MEELGKGALYLETKIGEKKKIIIFPKVITFTATDKSGPVGINSGVRDYSVKY